MKTTLQNDTNQQKPRTALMDVATLIVNDAIKGIQCMEKAYKEIPYKDRFAAMARETIKHDCLKEKMPPKEIIPMPAPKGPPPRKR